MGESVFLLKEDDVLKVLDGAYDMHCHAFPDPHIDTGWDQVQVTKAATDIGMGGVVFKAHTFPTAATVPFVNQAVEAYAKACDKKPAHAYGGIVLNNYVGGLNPESVEMVARLGGKVVWLPSHDSAHHNRVIGEPVGIELLYKNRQQPCVLRKIGDNRETRLVNPDVLGYFDVTRLDVTDEIAVEDNRFSIDIVAEGAGTIEGDFGTMPVRRGEAFACAASVGLRFHAKGSPLAVVRCMGPLI
jgi:hypothetical protein